MVQTKEAWAAALTGGSMPLMDNAPPEDRTPSAMLARLERADAAFHGVLTDVRNRSAWDDTFVDALCEPPETFTFGGMFAHVITFNAYRRMVAIDALRGLGVKVEGFGCPTEYVASLTADPNAEPCVVASSWPALSGVAHAVTSVGREAYDAKRHTTKSPNGRSSPSESL